MIDLVIHLVAIGAFSPFRSRLLLEDRCLLDWVELSLDQLNHLDDMDDLNDPDGLDHRSADIETNQPASSPRENICRGVERQVERSLVLQRQTDAPFWVESWHQIRHDGICKRGRT